MHAWQLSMERMPRQGCVAVPRVPHGGCNTRQPCSCHHRHFHQNPPGIAACTIGASNTATSGPCCIHAWACGWAVALAATLLPFAKGQQSRAFTCGQHASQDDDTMQLCKQLYFMAASKSTEGKAGTCLMQAASSCARTVHAVKHTCWCWCGTHCTRLALPVPATTFQVTCFSYHLNVYAHVQSTIQTYSHDNSRDWQHAQPPPSTMHCTQGGAQTRLADDAYASTSSLSTILYKILNNQ